MGLARNEYDLRRRLVARYGHGAKLVHYTDALGSHYVKAVYAGGETLLTPPCASTTRAYLAASRRLNAPPSRGAT